MFAQSCGCHSLERHFTYFHRSVFLRAVNTLLSSYSLSIPRCATARQSGCRTKASRVCRAGCTHCCGHIYAPIVTYNRATNISRNLWFPVRAHGAERTIIAFRKRDVDGGFCSYIVRSPLQYAVMMFSGLSILSNLFLGTIVQFLSTSSEVNTVFCTIQLR